MCSLPKVKTVQSEPSEIIKTATKADASVSNNSVASRKGGNNVISESKRTNNIDINDDVVSSKKKLLGE